MKRPSAMHRRSEYHRKLNTLREQRNGAFHFGMFLNKGPKRVDISDKLTTTKRQNDE